MVTHLVQRVHRDPAQRSFPRRGKVVHHGALPLVGSEARQDIAEQQGRVAQLTRDIARILLGVPVVRHPAVAVHRVERRRVDQARGEDSFALYEQHVANVAAVLEWRPQVRLPPRPHVCAGALEHVREQPDTFDDRAARRPGLVELVLEAASRGAVHVKCDRRCGPRRDRVR